MPAWLSRLSQRFPKPVLIWAVLALLLGLGVLSSISDLAGVPAQETMRANSEQQRVIIDPRTGDVAGGDADARTADPFDVADEAPPAEEPAAEPVEEEPAAEEPAPVEEHPVEEEPAVEESSANSQFELLPTTRKDPATPLVARSSESLVTAPAPEISEKVEKELLPKRGDKDVTPALIYAKAFKREKEDHLVAIVVMDVGFNGEILAQALALPTEITIGISPYADAAADQIGALRNKGHEVWGMLPVMGASYPQTDPGPLGLINALTIKGAMARLHSIMANTLGSVGFVLPSDETLSNHKDLWKPILDEIHARGLYVLSTHATREPKELTADKKQQGSIRRSHMILDSTPGAAFLRSKLAGVRDAAAKQPELIVLVGARPQALKLLDEWLKTKPLEGVAKLVPLSAIYVPYTEPVEVPEEEGGHGGGGKKEEGGHGEEKAESGGHGGGH